MIFFDNREASKTPWTKEVWYYDYRTNIHHTLKKKPLRFEHLAEFIDATIRRTAQAQGDLGRGQKIPKAAGANSPTKNSSPATRQVSMCSGSKIRASPISTICRSRTNSPRRSSKIWKLV